MTTYATTQIPTDVTPRRLAVAGVSTALVAVGWSVYGAHHWNEIATVSIVAALVAGLVYGIVMPWGSRRPDPGNTALGLSVSAALLVFPAFWSGLPLVLGVAGMMLGNAGRTRPSGAGRSIGAIALGALAAVGYLTIFIWDGVILGHSGFLFD